VNAFWSITMYDGKTQLLIENPIGRYLVMRLYWPRTEPPSILPPGEGSWQPPPLQKVAGKSKASPQGAGLELHRAAGPGR